MAKAQCHRSNKGNNSWAFFIVGNTPVTAVSYHSNKNVVFYKFKCAFIWSPMEGVILISCVACSISAVKSSGPSLSLSSFLSFFFFLNSSPMCFAAGRGVPRREFQKGVFAALGA